MFETIIPGGGDFGGAPPGFGGDGAPPEFGFSTAPSGPNSASPSAPPRRRALPRGTGQPLVPRDPLPDHQLPRLRRLTEVVSECLNSLLVRGYLIRDNVGRWSIAPNPFTEPRDPTANDDQDVGVLLGDHWINTETNAIWYCVRTEIGSAVWVQVGGPETLGGSLLHMDTFP